MIGQPELNTLRWAEINGATANDWIPNSALQYTPRAPDHAAIIFIDMQCSHCQEFVPKIKAASDRLRMKLVVRHLPLELSEEKLEVATLMEAANLNGKGWAFLMRVDEEQMLSVEQFRQLARSMAIPTDLATLSKARANVNRDSQFASKLGLSGTPTIALLGPGTVEILNQRDFESRFPLGAGLTAR